MQNIVSNTTEDPRKTPQKKSPIPTSAAATAKADSDLDVDIDTEVATVVAAKPLSIAEQINELTDPSFMTSLARGLAVIKAFSDHRRAMTIAQLSQKTGIPRAAVRRCLYTLKQLGYADSEANNFFLKPGILALGYAFLSSTPLTVAAQPYLNELSHHHF